MQMNLPPVPIAAETAARRKHLMFGRPRSLRHRERYCILHQEAFVSAYSSDLKMALWSSFSVDVPVCPPAEQLARHHLTSCGRTNGRMG